MNYLEERAKSMAEQPVYPPSQSYSGNNAYYEGACEPAGYTPSYATCLHKIRALERDGSLEFPACQAAIQGGSCMAVGMRKREEDAGRALYYWDRKRMLALNDVMFESAMRAAGAPNRPPRLKQEPKSDARQPTGPTERGFAAAINNAMKDLEQTHAVATSQSAKQEIQPAAGLSLMEIARLRMKTNHQKEIA